MVRSYYCKFKNVYLKIKLPINTEAVAQRCSVRKIVLRNFVKFAGKHLCQSLFFNKVDSDTGV